MVTFAQLREARPSVLAEAAEAWEPGAKAMGRRAEEMPADVLDALPGRSSEPSP